MNVSVETVLAGLAGLLGIGAIGTGGGKAAGMFKAALNMLRQLVVAICGDGTPEHPGLRGEVAELKKTAVTKDEIADLKGTVAKLQVSFDKHVDGDAPTWRAEGQAWGDRLQAQGDDNTRRIDVLENRMRGTDPVTG